MDKRGGCTHRCLFRKKDILTTKSEIRNILYNGIKIKGPLLEYSYFIKDRNRVAVVVKKVQNSAVKRNKVRRRIREIYRKNRPETPCDLIIRVKKNLIAVKYNDMEKEILKQIKKIN